MSTGAEFYPTPKDAEVNVKTWFCLSAYLWLARLVEVWVRGGPGWLKLVQKFPFLPQILPSSKGHTTGPAEITDRFILQPGQLS